MRLRLHGRSGTITSLPLMLLLLAGCSGGDSIDRPELGGPTGSPADDSVHACDLVSRDEVVMAMAQPMSNGQGSSGRAPGQTSCGFFSQNAPIVVTVAIIPPPADELWASVSADERATPVDLGEDAFTIDGGVLWVRQADTVVNVVVGGLDPRQAEIVTVTLAEIALSRL